MLCVSFTSSSSDHQSSCSLVQTCETYQVTGTTVEEAVRAHVHEENDVEIFESDDAALLHCRFVDNDEQSIFGVTDDNEMVHVTKLEPCIDASREHGCCCDHPRRDWTRKPLEINSSSSSTIRELLIVDLTTLQTQRRIHNYIYPSFDTPGKVFHLLRSILTCENGLHCASPWYHPSSLSPCSHDKTVALLIKSPVESENDFWGELEKRELSELVNFRTGDAAPSYYLHSTTNMKAELIGTHQFSNDLTMATLFQSEARSNSILLVFKHLPPRDVLTAKEPEHTDCNCNVEIMRGEDYMGCMWQKYVQIQSMSESDEDNPTTAHRIISPPYLSCEQEYPGLLDDIISNIDEIREEALKIPQWTAWPERNHYSSSTNGENDPYAAWTVFPLCHTFPANDVSQRKFIENTCTFVPKTTALLQNIGPKLRTSLFSRLDKRTTLGTHTGWSDLANHVLRVHIPLIVPAGESCGTWVDGW